MPPTANKHILLATSGFSAQAGSVTPDYILPVSSFFNPAGDTVRIFHPSFGEFHSKTFTAVPSDGVQSLNYPPAAGTAVANTPTNFGGMVGSIDLTPPPDTTGDYNGDLTVDAADYTVWRDTLGQSVTPKGSGADGIADGTIDELDYAFWKQHFGDVLGGTGDGSTSIDLVPEPELAALAGSGLAVIFFAAARARSLRGRL